MKLELPEGKISAAKIYQAYMYSYPHKTAYGPLESVTIVDCLASCDLSQAEIYFHIPFCADKCGYCNLFSITGQSEEYFERYLSAMAEQISQYGLADLFSAGKLSPRRLTIGGGTPLILSEVQLDRLLRLLPSTDKTNVPAENICIETSPNETTKAKLEILKTFNVDRISVGVQSFLDNELKNLKRQHSSQSARNSLALIKEHAFPKLNLDLIYGIPGQTMASLQTSLEEGLKFDPDEFFVYPLYVRKGTGLANVDTSGANVDTGRANAGTNPNDNTLLNENIYDMYWLARDILTTAGYAQISMRRFVKNPPVSRSCGFETMLAIGCGGRSYLGNLHFCHPYAASRRECQKIIADYIDTPNKTQITWGYILNEDEQKRRFVIKNLLHVHGISFAEYRKIFKAELCDDFPILREWVERGYAEENLRRDFTQGADSAKIQLTALGLSLSDCLGPMLISAEVRRKIDAEPAN